jgi:hypothetical protein
MARGIWYKNKKDYVRILPISFGIAVVDLMTYLLKCSMSFCAQISHEKSQWVAWKIILWLKQYVFIFFILGFGERSGKINIFFKKKSMFH